jgi:hypothetical protein
MGARGGGSCCGADRGVLLPLSRGGLLLLPARRRRRRGDPRARLRVRARCARGLLLLLAGQRWERAGGGLLCAAAAIAETRGRG